jgi:hypothetical protein
LALFPVCSVLLRVKSFDTHSLFFEEGDTVRTQSSSCDGLATRSISPFERAALVAVVKEHVGQPALLA